MNLLCYGDNRDILKRYIKYELVDLFYLDPQFNSNATNNVLFSQKDGSQKNAHMQAFENTCHWDEEAARTYKMIVERGESIPETIIVQSSQFQPVLLS